MTNQKGKPDGAGNTIRQETGNAGRVFVSPTMIPRTEAGCNTHPPGTTLLAELHRLAVALFDYHADAIQWHEHQACNARRIWQALERLVGDG